VLFIIFLALLSAALVAFAIEVGFALRENEQYKKGRRVRDTA
jgi:hypothetical protein